MPPPRTVRTIAAAERGRGVLDAARHHRAGASTRQSKWSGSSRRACGVDAVIRLTHGSRAWWNTKCVTGRIGHTVSLDQQSAAGRDQAIARRERAEMARATGNSTARRARLLRNIWLGQVPREETLENLCSFERLGQIDPASNELFLVWDRDDQTLWCFGRSGKILFLDWIGRREWTPFRAVAASLMGVESATRVHTHGVCEPVLLRREPRIPK
jgi:hypothetical protein